MDMSTEQTIGEVSQDWQTSKSTIAQRATHLLMTGLYTDCQFLVGANGRDQELIKAHKIYLAQSSPVFEAMLFGKMTEEAATNELISIPDLTPSSFKDLLQYIYTDSVEFQSMDQAMGLCYAAKKYILPDLVAKCFQYMMDNLGPENTCRVLEFTNLFEDENLKAKCLSLLREQTIESLTPPDFEELSEATVMSIVKDEAMNISELKLFDAVLRWAGYQCAQRDLQMNGANMRQILGEIIGVIRFLAMKPEEFVSTPALSGILTQEESFAILMNLNNPGSLPMPLHLSSCTIQRSAFSSRLKNGGRSTINGGTYCLRNILNETLILKEPFINKMTSFLVHQPVILKGIVLAGMVIADQQQVLNGLSDIVIDCHLLDISGTNLATARVSQPLSRRETPIIMLEPVFNCSVHLQPNCSYIFRFSVSQRAHFITGMAKTASCQGAKFTFSSNEWSGLVSGLIFDLP